MLFFRGGRIKFGNFIKTEARKRCDIWVRFIFTTGEWVIKYQEVCGGTGAPGITYTEVSTYAQRRQLCMYVYAVYARYLHTDNAGSYVCCIC